MKSFSAYKKDSANPEVRARYRRLAQTPAYFYTHKFEGDYSSYCSEGTYFVTASSTNHTITLRQNIGHFPVIDSLNQVKGLIAWSSSLHSKSVVATYADKVEVMRIPSLHHNKTVIRAINDITLARISGDEGKVLIVTPHTLECRDVGSKSPKRLFSNSTRKGIVTAFFSDDNKRIITGSEDGIIALWDAENGEKIIYPATTRRVISSYISSAGTYSLINTAEEALLYDSEGNSLPLGNLVKRYGSNSAAFFSEDGKTLCMVFIKYATMFLTSSKKNETKVWQYGYGANLALPELSSQDLKDLGIN